MASNLCPVRGLNSDLPVESFVRFDLKVVSQRGKIQCWWLGRAGKSVNASLARNSSVEIVQDTV